MASGEWFKIDTSRSFQRERDFVLRIISGAGVRAQLFP